MGTEMKHTKKVQPAVVTKKQRAFFNIRGDV